MSEKQEEFPIELRLVDLENSRVAYRKLSLKEFLKIAAVLGTVKFIDIGGNKMASCCYNKECVQRVNNKCIAGYKDNDCRNRKASFNALDFVKVSKNHLPVGESTPNPRQ